MPILAAHPFLDSFLEADWLGKGIYLSLLALSVICWIILIQKTVLTRQVHQQSLQFTRMFQKHKKSPLSFEFSAQSSYPLQKIYSVLKRQTLELLNKNHHFTKEKSQPATLSPTDIDFIDTHVSSSIMKEVRHMEKNLFILSTIVTLAPFLGLLGTVWGILVTFSELQSHQMANTNQMMLGGLSLALTTTVLGLIIAIPALIGYNYLKNAIKGLQTDMESFSSEVMASVELQYRQVDVKHE
ncbi:MAG: Biopolymer transport protein ExbB [Chlamydiae bacterium]|nr:Biopolymer transport protein ExbB [Chlamydiota bacterium]